jgi:hypothetical protein
MGAATMMNTTEHDLEDPAASLPDRRPNRHRSGCPVLLGIFLPDLLNPVGERRVKSARLEVLSDGHKSSRYMPENGLANILHGASIGPSADVPLANASMTEKRYKSFAASGVLDSSMLPRVLV